MDEEVAGPTVALESGYKVSYGGETQGRAQTATLRIIAYRLLALNTGR